MTRRRGDGETRRWGDAVTRRWGDAEMNFPPSAFCLLPSAFPRKMGREGLVVPQWMSYRN
ncbi:MAG: hypothetical protein F6K58_30175 [Symploca sp. SIO2E9]|nr:hypothetical protein [Symploca sp. SIO2E9]